MSTFALLRSRLPMLIVMVLAWIALWGDLSVANLLSGTLLAVAIVVAFSDRQARPRRGTIRPVATVRFGLWFLGALIRSSVLLAWEVLTPRNRIAEGIIAVPVRGISDELTVLVANVVSLIPGTVTLEARSGERLIYVHVLHLHDVGEVHEEVLHIEELATRAFGSSTSVEQLDDPATSDKIGEPQEVR
ncbi:MAG: Na+/H+ antiporter subunit E [Actinomycetota bacterium]|nr:Na+/H+ antiporter subunit E [Actinomycetota bacterium]